MLFMKYYEIESGRKTIVNLYTFIDNNGNMLIENILNEIPFFSDIGYAGFREKAALRKHLNWAIGSDKKKTIVFKKSVEKQSVQIIKNIVKK